MKTTFEDCPRCFREGLANESVEHDLIWRQNRLGNWRLFIRCQCCERTRPAPKSIDRKHVPKPDLADQIMMF